MKLDKALPRAEALAGSERILYYSASKIAGQGSNGGHSGVVALTPTRLIFVGGMMGDGTSEVQIPLTDITTFDTSKRLTSARQMRVTAAGGRRIFYGISKECADAVGAAWRAL